MQQNAKKKQHTLENSFFINKFQNIQMSSSSEFSRQVKMKKTKTSELFSFCALPVQIPAPDFLLCQCCFWCDKQNRENCTSAVLSLLQPFLQKKVSLHVFAHSDEDEIIKIILNGFTRAVISTETSGSSFFSCFSFASAFVLCNYNESSC